jgi:hypothetical protein
MWSAALSLIWCGAVLMAAAIAAEMKADRAKQSEHSEG